MRNPTRKRKKRRKRKRRRRRTRTDYYRKRTDVTTQKLFEQNIGEKFWAVFLAQDQQYLQEKEYVLNNDKKI